jgi:hypothetical protein
MEPFLQKQWLLGEDNLLFIRFNIVISAWKKAIVAEGMNRSEE